MADPTVLMTGIAMGESPRWHDGRLWFADWVAQQLIAVDLDGKSDVIAHVPSFPFSIDWLPDGTLLIVAGAMSGTVRLGADGNLIPHVDLAGVCDQPNEIVIDGRGNTYINNIGFNMMAGEAPTTGTIALITPDGAARQVADGVLFPNGMAITPDNKTLIVGESYGRKLTAFDIAPDGGLSAGRVWADLGEGTPDGICIDAEGAVWYADVPNKRCVRVREGGLVLQTVNVDRGCFACMLGGSDGRTLFIVAQEWRGPEGIGAGEPTGRILTVEAPAPHAGWP